MFDWHRPDLLRREAARLASRPTVARYGHRPFALAEALGGTLLTLDERLARVPGLDCVIEIP